ncbi:hypothetical protein D0469_16045 [Peribacillus saganii]|uniref:EpsG family protein n=1 Tax=Peribacillus saganii TaxID=2303992 RepID=A0A372LLK2_9BACI|nr:EpsG family protein [Peribacillus saganii]RFU67126.1 hypothetical protein D0469_16045 [Peribacillus saganii]
MFKELFAKKQHDTNLRTKRNIYLLFSILIGLLLIFPEDITWARDRLSYLEYASSSWTIMQRYINSGIFSFFSNEPLFLTINIILSSFLVPENVVKCIIFTSTIGVLYSLGKITKYNFLILLFFLLVPQVVKNHVIHLRQGLALSIYLLGLVSNKKYGGLLRCLSIFIHTSFVFLILFEFLEIILKRVKFTFTVRILLSSIFLTIFIQAIPVLASLFEDRRAQAYDFTMAEGSSGLGFLAWLFVGSLFILVTKKDYINTITCYGILFYLMSYFLLDFSARIFENIIPLILIGVLSIQSKYTRTLFIMFFILYSSLIWYLSGFSFLI